MGSGCHVCGQRVNGKLVSQPQRTLAQRIGGELNHPFGRRCIDVAVVREGVRIAVEYDAWYYHGGRQDADAERDRELIAAGWRVLRVRSAYLVPSRNKLEATLARLVAGETRVEITLGDWGVGPCRSGTWDPSPPQPFQRGRG
jgi:very-short-patch-repair endonuclease